MAPFLIPLIMTGAKMFGDAKREQKQKELASATQRYSPWTGLKAGAVDYADPTSALLQGAGTALSQEQMSQQAESDKQMRELQMKLLQKKINSPWGGMQQADGLDKFGEIA